jgi:hypothetical protein
MAWETDMKIVKISAALKRLHKLNEEIRYADCFEAKQFTSGLIAFRPTKSLDRKQINHDDKDVVCHVLKGRGPAARQRAAHRAPGVAKRVEPRSFSGDAFRGWNLITWTG